MKPSFVHFSTAPGGGGLCLESGTSQQQPGEGFSVKGKQGPEVAEASEGGGSLSIVGGLIIGDVAVSLNWASVEVLFYAAVTLLASLAHRDA